MAKYISADHIAKQSGAFEPQRKNNFTVRISAGASMIQLALDSFPLPKESNGIIDINYGNEVRKVAGIATFENLELVVKDFADQPVMESLVTWRKQVYDASTGEIGLAKEYKQQGEVTMMAPNGSLLRTWRLEGCWPSSMDPGGGDMNANENNKITVVITIDRAFQHSA